MNLYINGLSDYAFLSKKNEYCDFGGSGDNESPSLSWENAPQETKSFAITVYDPDAPTGSGFWHWIAYNIPSDKHSLPAGAGTLFSSAIKQASSDFGTPGYGGCCPPKGDIPHRYIFTLHALSCNDLGVSPDLPNAVIRFLINMNTISKASVITLYKR
ncbi:MULTISPECIES: YbhB/YbcL family Raf kinase inhibitor-like protein [Tenebrionibacter/Tenebrionicola group]|jgi:Raf kinase inhibitor-like YbhB/YbcL family protein|uniref:YbhB/YbcL family Raf kinase inhibitor-like protein n=2 Tax=Tenebrionibacter/Tenebrionicola group TaxID=2969848 RepID=A0A8K0XXJ7_9ENTR|nr:MULTISPECIES: YbhB/YbcL family Raf kinase inhibitor-like protein [Tenebrionibacter/Tenebrionicola group]MBK4716655.1 YbhB/YbcL family Raf kinase inhibitor-like protein [Tenebrionibacter intestinalis]MBV5097329.1 YbhB/YbcL family Raf kinase inhibitor-like protein [Tenebrionicola larvae]